MHHLRRSVISANKHRWFSILKPQNGFRSVAEANRHKCVSDVGLAAPFSSKAKDQILSHPTLFDFVKKGIAGVNGNSVPLKGHWMKEYNAYSSLHKSTARSFSSTATEQQRNKSSKPRKEISTTEDPFDPLTDKIPEKPVTFVEGASYSLVILAGLGIAAAAAYAVFSELIFEPKEYKVFGKALERVQNDGQVRVRIGSPITGYGQESRNRAARQRIPNRIRTDEDGVEHIQVNFFIRGPQGSGKVWAEMFKDKKDKEWKYTSLIVEITSPSRTQLILESYLPSSDTAAFTPSR